MENWDGKERRLMNQDQINRDRLLSEVHSDIKHLLKWADEHTKDDEKRFKEVDTRMKMAEKVIYGALGIFLFVQFVVNFVK
jgi:hypothetical protein